MAPWPLRLHHRIVVPFALVALVTISGAAWAALWMVSQTFESRIHAQIVNTAEVIGRGGLSLNPIVLRSVKAISGADVITFSGEAILASTIEPDRSWLAALVTSGEGAREAMRPGEPAVIHRLPCDSPCFVVYQPLAERPGARVAVVAETSEVAAATRSIAQTILLAAVASLTVMLVVSQVVARRVTAPLERLVQFAQGVAAGPAPGARAAAGDDEVGRLGHSFNEMLDRLHQSQAALVRSEKLALAGHLAARVAHDLRNPLSSIKMQTQLLRSRVGSDPLSATMVEAVLHDVGQVEHVIRDLIELARPGEIAPRPADANAVVGGMLRHLEGQLAHRKIAVEARLDEGLPLIPLDVERFKQALLNLLVNAADAMPEGGVLTVATAATGSGTIVIDVCDTGTGIDPSIRDSAFEPFVSSKPGGVGLGLVNVRAVVELHGGSIELAARQPVGTRARVTLPMGQERDPSRLV